MFIVHFVEYLKDLLENSLFVLKTEANLYILGNVLENGKKKVVFNCVYLQCSRGVTGISRSSLLLLSVSRSVMLLSYCFATQRLEMINANIYMAYTIYEFIHIFFCCFFAIN